MNPRYFFFNFFGRVGGVLLLKGNSLYILGPFRGITERHESTVGQDGEHDQHAEHRGNAS